MRVKVQIEYADLCDGDEAFGVTMIGREKTYMFTQKNDMIHFLYGWLSALGYKKSQFYIEGEFPRNLSLQYLKDRGKPEVIEYKFDVKR